MANDFLVSKWKMWFSWFDHNKDGKVCREDLETSRNRFANLHHFEAERKKAAMATYTLWWGEYLMWGKSEITEAEFIENQNKAFEDSKEEFVERMNKNQDIVCNLLDTDGDGLITEEDLLIMFQSTEHDETVGKRWFNAHDPVDGKVPVKKMADMWTQLLTEEDSSKPDALVKQFQTGL
ncbi:sarcoplasmic calcium-binding protein-like [Mercenaria mercenaria]|uniref:sarcoplasmic calcium-binding protein-like n=1 Tax=Mercenaria mercenaria TaxID=6596 RepID=UPI00234E9FB0|nr:sarcoplasmic calcium-binding protein-like [Mercenaria mercenaria]